MRIKSKNKEDIRKTKYEINVKWNNTNKFKNFTRPWLC